MTTDSIVTPTGKITQEDFVFSAAVLERYTEPWDCPTLGEYVSQHARERPDALALEDDTNAVTWRQLETLVQNSQRTLHESGVSRGDVVIVQGDNSIEMVVMMLSVMEMGAVLGPIQDRATGPELEFVLKATGAKFCFIPDSGIATDHADMLHTLIDGLDTVQTFALVSLRADGTGLDFDWKKAEAERASQPWEPVRVGGADCVRVMYTSGSTGTPKGVLHSLGATVSACRVSVDVHHWTADSVGWVVVPIALNWGQFQLFSGIISGGMIRLRRRHDGDALLAAIERDEVTHVGLPPTGYISLITKIDTTRGKRIGRLTTLVSTGAPCGRSLLQELYAVFGVHVSEAYGITEGGWVATNEGEGSVRTYGADVGEPTPGTLVRILDQDAGDPLPHEQVGSIQLSGSSLFCGYYNNPEQNAASTTEDGWFHTGDLGYISNDGHLILTGREKDVIKHGGHLITPLEIEEAIYKLGPHREVVVLGMPDDYYGEKIVAVFERSDEEAPSLDDVKSYLDGTLAKFKWPQEVFTVDELPRTPNGKVKKNVLLDELKALVAADSQN